MGLWQNNYNIQENFPATISSGSSIKKKTNEKIKNIKESFGIPKNCIDFQIRDVKLINIIKINNSLIRYYTNQYTIHEPQYNIKLCQLTDTSRLSLSTVSLSQKTLVHSFRQTRQTSSNFWNLSGTVRKRPQ